MTNSITKANLMRSFYKSQEAGSSSETVRELKQIKNEIKIANDLSETEEAPLTNKTNSPYAPDQPAILKEVIYNSEEETDWKKVRSYEESRREAFVFTNLKRLNIL
jgi:hypothetical protein